VVSLQHVLRYGDGLLPLLLKDPNWPHPERAVNKGNDRHRDWAMTHDPDLKQYHQFKA
jgi:hypothetical protein